ncbi:MAG TPA: glycosyltransferase family protein [Flavisolibacter sp.]|jgi:uncharacterized protein (TIGR00661 family)|nr:glycosyltransferase family protein [Flavisolibacter sp.]
MKILYAIQGTGNGHLTVALEVLPYLMKRGTVDILLSGTEVDVTLPYEVKYRFQGLCFVFGKMGGIDYLETYKKAKLRTLFAEIKSLPVEDYDLVFSDFEPVSAWACYLKNKPCIGFSHQAAVVNKAAPQPNNADLIGRAVLKYYAPVSVKYGFHFVPYNKNIFTPIIRKEIRSADVTANGHYTVYLPSYSEKRIHRLLSCFPDKQWEVFSKRRTEPGVQDNITFRPVTGKAFVQSLVSSSGVLCGAGFQTPSEALFLQKKLLVIPMKGQYEQQCNAAALKLLGVPVLKNLKPKQYKKLKGWLETENQLRMHFPDETEWILSDIIARHQGQMVPPRVPGKPVSSFSRFRTLILDKIFYGASTR